MSLAVTNTEQVHGTQVARISGGGTTSVLNGPGVLFSVIPAILSGVGASGIIVVFDSISGATVFGSGATTSILFFNSGTSTTPFYGPQPFLSGLNVNNSVAGVVVTVTYRAGL